MSPTCLPSPWRRPEWPAPTCPDCSIRPATPGCPVRWSTGRSSVSTRSGRRFRMNDVAALEFTRQHAQPIPAERREELLATPGFGDVFSDHMVTVRWSAEVGWHDAQVGPLAAMSLHPATMALHYGQTIFEGTKAFWRPNGQRALFRPADHAPRLT